jgi:hypothetical protein
VPRYSTLSDVLAAEDAKRQVVADCQALIEQQVSATSGVGGVALKAAFKTVTTFAPGYYESRVERIVPDLMRRLQPFWADFQSSGNGAFGDYLAGRGTEVADSVLAVTDLRARRSNRTAVTSVYKAVRGSAAEHIQAALPAVGALVEKYAA